MKFIDKSKTKRLGVLLIIIGAFIPSILYPFTSLTRDADIMKMVFGLKGGSYDTSLQDLEIVLVRGEWKENNKNGGGHFEGRLALPYKYTMAFGILLSFIGIAFVAFYKNKRASD